jgi:hypothetical protein
VSTSTSPTAWLRQAALTLRAAAAYIDAHGYYIPLDYLGVEDPDFPCEYIHIRGLHTYPECLFPDHYDRHSRTPATPAASAEGAIAYAAYGRLTPDPIDDGSVAYQRYCDAVSLLAVHYAPTGDGYGEWVYPASLSATLRTVARDCDDQAADEHTFHWRSRRCDGQD